MTNIFKDPRKKLLRKRLLEVGIETLRRLGWSVERTTGGASVRLIKKDGERARRVSIRTTQDQWIAFPRRADDAGWGTLADVDVVLAVSVDDPRSPAAALVHWLEGDDMRARFDRAYATRLEAGHTITPERGVWIPLYIGEDGVPTHAGGGGGIEHPPIARVSLLDGAPQGTGIDGWITPRSSRAHQAPTPSEDQLLTIAEAKRRLALTFGVSETSIKISVEA